MSEFKKEILQEIEKKKSYLCVGLDPFYNLLPLIFQKTNRLESIFNFLKEVVNITINYVPCYKPNLSCYSYYGPDGWHALKKINEYIKKKDENIKIIAECKRTEIFQIGHLSAKELLEYYYFDAYNIMPWYGHEAVEPICNYVDKGKAIFVICHDSNPSAVELQDLVLKNNQPLYLYLAKRVIKYWNKSGNVFLESALTYPKQLNKIIALDKKQTQFHLIVGLGTQGGNINDLKVFQKTKNFVVSASRSILYPTKEKDFSEKIYQVTQEYIQKINKIIKE